jgi:hypothetical protein
MDFSRTVTGRLSSDTPTLLDAAQSKKQPGMKVRSPSKYISPCDDSEKKPKNPKTQKPRNEMSPNHTEKRKITDMMVHGG